jgi:hypothetical protein
MGFDGCLAVKKEYRWFYLCSSFLYYPLSSLNDVYFSLEYRGVEPTTEAVLPA